MKHILFFSILFSVIVLPAFCQAPQSSVETDIAVIKTEIKNLKEIISTGFSNVQQNFDTAQKNVQQNFDTVQKNVQQNFDTVQKNVQQNFDTVQKNFDRQNNIIIACIGIPWAVLAIGATVWGILAHRRSKKDHTLEMQIEALTQEIETLKQQRIVNP